MPPSAEEELQSSSISFLIIAGVGVGLNLFCAFLLSRAGVDHHGVASSHSHSHSHAHGSVNNDHNERRPILDDDHHDDHHDDHGGGRRNVNIFAMVVHLIGDVFSSLVVLTVGLLYHFVTPSLWLDYIDEIGSIIIVLIIVFSTVPQIRKIVNVLMQSTPDNLDVAALQNAVQAVPGLKSVHDLHVWQLIDGLVIASLHAVRTESGDDENINSNAVISAKIRDIFHKFNVHNVTIQIELTHTNGATCGVLCAVGCSEKKCC